MLLEIQKSVEILSLTLEPTMPTLHFLSLDYRLPQPDGGRVFTLTISPDAHHLELSAILFDVTRLASVKCLPGIKTEGGSMTQELTDEEKQIHRAKVAGSNRSFGRVLSVAGVILTIMALALLVAGGVVMSALDRARISGENRSDLETIASFTATALTAPPGLILLFAMCALITGEQLRRGWIGPSAKPQKGTLPSASMVSQFRVLGFGWHILWAAVGLVISVVLIGVPLSGWFSGGWPATLSLPYDFTGFWLIYGSLAFAITVTAFVSLAKKAWYLAALRRGIATPEGGPGKALWRWVDYRWRFDLWIGGFGGLLIALSVTFLSNAVGPTASADKLPAALPPFLLLGGAGLVLVVLALAAAAQFWRAGESLGSGESFA